MSFTKQIEKAAEKQRKRFEEQKEVSEKLATEMATLFIEVPDLKKIVLKAYTPGFNDGDPCTHSQCEASFYIENSDWIASQFKAEDSSEDEDEEDDDYDEDFEDENYYYSELTSSYNKNKIPKDVAAKLKVVNSLLNKADDLFETMFGTNWELIFTLDPKKQQVEVEHNEYYCGH